MLSARWFWQVKATLHLGDTKNMAPYKFIVPKSKIQRVFSDEPRFLITKCQLMVHQNIILFKERC